MRKEVAKMEKNPLLSLPPDILASYLNTVEELYQKFEEAMDLYTKIRRSLVNPFFQYHYCRACIGKRRCTMREKVECRRVKLMELLGIKEKSKDTKIIKLKPEK